MDILTITQIITLGIIAIITAIQWIGDVVFGTHPIYGEG